MGKITCEMYLSTPPVGYSGSPSTVNKTNCTNMSLSKNLMNSTNSIQTCPTMKCLRKDAISCIVVEKWVLQLARLTRGGDGF